MNPLLRGLGLGLPVINQVLDDGTDAAKARTGAFVRDALRIFAEQNL